MTLSLEETSRIANLSKLETNDETLTQYQADLNRIITLFNRIKAIDTDGIDAMISPLQNNMAMRDDLASIQDLSAQFAKIAPEFQSQHFVVPKVIE